jgi:hypothetical protein
MANKKDKKVDEISTSASAGGYAAPLGWSREDLMSEIKLREAIRKIINKSIAQQRKEYEEQLQKENLLRQAIRKLIVEAKKDIEDTPYSSTAINLLEELLKQILPTLETDYKTLTTSKEQRDSYRAHIINAISTSLETEDVNKEVGETAEMEADALNLAEQEDDVTINIDDDEQELDFDVEDQEKFIDIDAPEEEVEDEFAIEGQDETGKAMAQRTFDRIEKNIIDTYAILNDEKDEKLFKDYLITNVKLYFDKYEKELGNVVEPTTNEYEAEKAEQDMEPEAPPAEDEMDFEPDVGAAGGEELIQ